MDPKERDTDPDPSGDAEAQRQFAEQMEQASEDDQNFEGYFYQSWGHE